MTARGRSGTGPMGRARGVLERHGDAAHTTVRSASERPGAQAQGAAAAAGVLVLLSSRLHDCIYLGGPIERGSIPPTVAPRSPPSMPFIMWSISTVVGRWHTVP